MMRNSRMEACVKILQASDKALRSTWKKHCGTLQIDQELANDGPQRPLAQLNALFSSRVSAIIDAGTCSDAVTPVAKTDKCGLGTKTLFSNLQAGATVRIPLPNGQCGALIPLLLTNKTDFACNAVQSRVACVDVSHDLATDRTRIRFSSRRTGPAETTTIEFGATELGRVEGRIDDLISHPQFALIPAIVNGKSVTDKILAAAKQKQQSCLDQDHHAAARCVSLARFQADAYMQEAMRRFRNPKHDSSLQVIAKDGENIVAFLKSRGIDRIEEKWILFLSIAGNEVGPKVSDNGVVAGTYDPIYGLSDAVYDNSGLTFGAHQIDLGANGDREVKLFWDVIDAYSARHSDPAVASAKAARDCVDLPLRLMTIGALGITYRASSRMTVAMRSAEGVDEYNRRLLDWLTEETRITAAKPGLFKKSMIARVLFSDLKNQSGKGKHVEDLVLQFATQEDLNSCDRVVAAENRLLDAMIWVDPKTKQNKTNYAERYERIRTIVRQLAVREGIGGCR
jgi:hypothetical protein